MTYEKHRIEDSLVTVWGRVAGRVGQGEDGIIRFSLKNKSGYFYIQCHRQNLRRSDQIETGELLLVAGTLTSRYVQAIRRHQPIIQALSISRLTNHHLQPLLVKFELTDEADLAFIPFTSEIS